MIPAFVPDPVALTNFSARPNDFTVSGPSPALVFGAFDSEGVYWAWTDIEGWFTSTPFSALVEPRGNSDYGTWAERFARTPRAYTVKGFCYAAGKLAAMAARERLMTHWGDPNRVFDLVVDEPTEAKRATVRPAGPISAPWTDSISHAKGFSFEIPLIAKDSLKYSLAQISDTTGTPNPASFGFTFPLTFPLTFASIGGDQSLYAVLYNSGNEKSPPITTLKGAIASGWRIENLDDGGKTIWINKALGVSDTLELNHRDSTARLNGVPSDVYVYGDWFSLVPGLNRILLSSPTATDAQLTVSGYSAWR